MLWNNAVAVTAANGISTAHFRPCLFGRPCFFCFAIDVPDLTLVAAQ
jgi:hypothetical protein